LPVNFIDGFIHHCLYGFGIFLHYIDHLDSRNLVSLKSHTILSGIPWYEGIHTKKKFDEALRSTALSIISPAQSMDYSRRFHRDAVFLEEEAK
jgi:hypothetical protein